MDQFSFCVMSRKYIFVSWPEYALVKSFIQCWIEAKTQQKIIFCSTSCQKHAEGNPLYYSRNMSFLIKYIKQIQIKWINKKTTQKYTKLIHVLYMLWYIRPVYDYDKPCFTDLLQRALRKMISVVKYAPFSDVTWVSRIRYTRPFSLSLMLSVLLFAWKQFSRRHLTQMSLKM